MTVKKVLLDKISLININHKKCLIISVTAIVIGALLFLIIVPQLTKIVVEYLCLLKPGRFVRKKHESLIPLSYKLYLWNVTNPNEIAAGTDKPKLQEIGPYVFTEFQRKGNSSDNNTEDTYSFNKWSMFYFNSNLSAPLTGFETVTLLNIVLVGAAVKVNLERPNYIGIVSESMDLIFNNPTSIFLTMSAMEFIDNGIEINCNHTAYAAKVTCNEMRKNYLLKIMNADKTLLRFRWFDRINNTATQRTAVRRGSKNNKNIGMIAAVNDEPMLKVFKEDEKCNIVNGTDKTMAHPFQRRDEIIWFFAQDACRSFPLRFKHKKTIKYINTFLKSAHFTDPLVRPSCNCNKYTGCGFEGTIDLYYCVKLFASASPPHFYSADPYLLESVEGMKPKANLHFTGTYYDLLSGVPVRGHERIQVNVLIKRISEYPIFNSIANDIWLPVLWYDEMFTLQSADAAIVVTLSTFSRVGFFLGYIICIIGVIGSLVTIAVLVHHHVAAITEVAEVPEVQPEH